MSACGRGGARGCVESLHARTPSSEMRKAGMSRGMVFMVPPRGPRTRDRIADPPRPRRGHRVADHRLRRDGVGEGRRDRKSTRLNSSHTVISYAVFCLKKKKKKQNKQIDDI